MRRIQIVSIVNKVSLLRISISALTTALALVCLYFVTHSASASSELDAGVYWIAAPEEEVAEGVCPPEWVPLGQLTVDRVRISDDDHPAPRRGRWAGDPAKFFQGAFIAFLGHEAGHLIANTALDTDLFIKSVSYGPVPFFTIEPGRDLSRREHYVTASAGFNSQYLINEWLLSKHPDLRNEDESLLKGVATFNFWLGVGYAASALTRTGPNERDTKGMADALGWNERSVGALILVPTLLDAYRYEHPDAKWARRASRLTKALIVGLVAVAD